MFEICLSTYMYLVKTGSRILDFYNPGQKSLGHPEKTRKIGHLRKMPCVSLLLCLYHTVLVTALPPPTLCNVESTCSDSGCEGPFKSTLHWGWRGDAQICGVFAKVSQDFWPGLSENPSFNKTLGNVAKLEYILPTSGRNNS